MKLLSVFVALAFGQNDTTPEPAPTTPVPDPTTPEPVPTTIEPTPKPVVPPGKTALPPILLIPSFRDQSPLRRG